MLWCRFLSKEYYHSHFIVLGGSIHKRDIKSLSSYAINIRAVKCMKEKLTKLQEEIDTSTISYGQRSQWHSLDIERKKTAKVKLIKI